MQKGFGDAPRKVPNTAVIGGLAESLANPQPQCEANLGMSTEPTADGMLTANLTVYLKNWWAVACVPSCCIVLCVDWMLLLLLYLLFAP